MSIINGVKCVEGVGPLDAKVVIVGDFPSLAEYRAGEPIKGNAGNIFMEILHNVGISRKECYITLLVKEVCVGKNVMDRFIKFKPRGVVEETQDFKAYRELLRKELLLLKANVVVALGDAATWALCERRPSFKWRGSVVESTLIPNLKVIPTLHPASLLYNYLWRYWVMHDLKKVRKESETPIIKPSKHSYIVEPSFIDAMQYLLEIKENKLPVACDIEVMNEEVSCISFAREADKEDPLKSVAISIPFARGYNNYYAPDQERELWLMIESILEDKDIKKIFQNGTFDITFLYSKYGIKTRNVDDTMVGQAILYPDFPKGLDFITSIYTDEPYYKDEGKKHFKFGGSSYDFWLYNAKDSAVCYEAIQKIKKDLNRTGNVFTYEQQVKLIEPLVAMSYRGVNVNLEAREKKSAEFDERIKTLTERLHSIAGYELNFASPKQLMEYFYEQKGHKPYVNRKTGKPTIDGMALKRLARKGFEEATIIQEIRLLAKRRSTYLEMQLDSDGRIRGSYNPVGTSSLRLSSSKTIFDTGGNMQNLPYDIREFLEADAGYVCFQMDLGQAENRMVAYVAGEENMIEAFESGKDIHRRTAGLIFGKPEDEISDEDFSSTIGDGTKSERFWGKKANHGLNYDFGYKSFALMYEIPEADAKFIVDRYHMAYPGIRRYHRWVKEQLNKDRTLTNIFGWKRLFLDRWDDKLFKEAYSFIPQSSIGCLMNYHGVMRLYYDCPYKEVEILNQIHDAIWFQVPIKVGWKQVARIILWIKANLEQPISWRVREFSIPVDTEMGLNFGHATDDNPKGLHKLKFSSGTSIEELANILETTYSKMA